MKYARILIEHCPKDATELFIDYYTGKYRPRRRAALPELPTPTGRGLASGAASAVQNLTNFLPLPYIGASVSAPPATQPTAPPGAGAPPTGAETAQPTPPKYSPPSPRSAFSSFIEHPDEFIVFLEACLGDASTKESARS